MQLIRSYSYNLSYSQPTLPMKPRILSLLVLPTLLFQTAEAANVEIPDAKLDSVIRSTLKLDETVQLTTDHLESLTKIDYDGKRKSDSVKNLEGLQHAVNLTSLELERNLLTDLSPIAGLTKLTNLRMWGCKTIVDITPLANLASLKSLQIHDNLITDLTPLEGLTNLTSLTILTNPADDLTPIGSLTNLVTLNIGNMQNVTSFEPIQNLPKLKTLTISHYSGLDLTPISKLTTLTSINGFKSNYGDLSALSTLTNLQTVSFEEANLTSTKGFDTLSQVTNLRIRRNNITDISQLSGMTALKNLDLEDNEVTDISSLSGLTALETLDLQRNQISDITPLGTLANLGHLTLTHNDIPSIAPLANHPSIHSLYIGGNEIADLTPAASIPTLVNLFAASNQITELPEMDALTNLGVLDINNNQISDISNVEPLASLTRLYADSNGVTTIGSWKNLTKIELLYLQENQITNFHEVGNCTALQQCYINDNPAFTLGDWSNLKNLWKLYAYNCRLEDVSTLGNCVKMKELQIHNNRIHKTGDWSGLSALASLTLYTNYLQDASGLENCTALKTLQIQHNQILELDFSNLTKLTSLTANLNHLSDVSSLSNCTKLSSLRISENRIKDIGFLASMPNLTRAELGHNLIQGEVTLPDSFTKITNLFLNNNQITQLNNLEVLESITSRGHDFRVNSNFLDIGEGSVLANFSDELKARDTRRSPTIYLNPQYSLAEDTDKDGAPSSWEITHGTNALRNDSTADPDGDFYTNAEEFQLGTHPTDPTSFPTFAPTAIQLTTNTAPENAPNHTIGQLMAHDQDSAGGFEVIRGTLSWEDARKDAISKGGHLATINSFQDQRLVQSLIPGHQEWHHFWLGAHNKTTNGLWTHWITGEPLTFTSWGPGEPNGGTREPYLEYNNYPWYDYRVNSYNAWYYFPGDWKRMELVPGALETLAYESHNHSDINLHGQSGTFTATPSGKPKHYNGSLKILGSSTLRDINDNFTSQDYFTIHFRGYFQAETQGTYEFGNNQANTRLAFWIDRDKDGLFEHIGDNGRESMVQNWGTGYTEVELAPGFYPVSILLYDTSGDEALEPTYRIPGGERTIINPGTQANHWYARPIFDFEADPDGPSWNDEHPAEDWHQSYILEKNGNFELVEGEGATDNALFTINNGQLQLTQAQDFETNSILSVRVKVTDRHGLEYEQPLAITISDVNEPSTGLALSTTQTPEDRPAGSLVSIIITEDPDENDTFTYALVEDALYPDNACFAINGSQLLAAKVLDRETQATYTICLQSTDAAGNQTQANFTIEALDMPENAPPSELSISTTEIQENLTPGARVATFDSIDTDYELFMGGIGTYSLVNKRRTDFTRATKDAKLKGGHLAAITSKAEWDILVKQIGKENLIGKNILLGGTDEEQEGTWAWVTGEPFSYERWGDPNPDNHGDGQHHLQIWSEYGEDLLWDDVDPAVYQFVDFYILEKPVTYKLVEGKGDTHNHLYKIMGNTLVVEAPGDFESDPRHNIRVQVMDNGGLHLEKTFVLNLKDAPDAPLGITISKSEVPENQPARTEVGKLAMIDPESDEKPYFKILSEDPKFLIIRDSLQTRFPLDFETQPVHTLTIEARDKNRLTVTQEFTITVTDNNDAPTSFQLSSYEIPENAPANTQIATLTASDPDANDTHTFKVVGGKDASLVRAKGTALTTVRPLDYETKQTVQVIIQALDAKRGTFEQSVTLHVTDQNDTPTGIHLSHNQFAENLPPGSMVAEVRSEDVDPPQPNFKLVDFSGNWYEARDEALAQGGQLASFADPGEWDSMVAQIGSSNLENRNIWLGGTDEAREGDWKWSSGERFTYDRWAGPTNGHNGNPNNGEGEGQHHLILWDESGSDLEWDDYFGDQTLEAFVLETGGSVFEFVEGRGDTDNASFTIMGNRLLLNSPADFEVQSKYSIRLRVTDPGGLAYENEFAFSVTDAPDRPTAISLSTTEIPENQPKAYQVGTFTAADQDKGDKFFYYLAQDASAGGNTQPNDNGLFYIRGDKLHTYGPFDYETRTDYTIRVEVRDKFKRSHFQDIALTVTDGNDTPVSINVESDLTENYTRKDPVATFSTLDPDDGLSLPDGLIAYIDFEDGQGTTVSDRSPNANHGTLHSSATDDFAWVEGKFGKGLQLVTDGVVSLPHIDAYLLDEGTFSIWFKPEQTTSMGLLSKDSTGQETGGHLYLELTDHLYPKVRHQKHLSGEFTVQSSNTDKAIEGQWNHAAVTFGSRGLNIHLNGEIVAANLSSKIGIGTSSGGTGNPEPIALGALSSSSDTNSIFPANSWFHGTLDEFRIYNRQLTKEEVSAIHQQAAPPRLAPETTDHTYKLVSGKGGEHNGKFYIKGNQLYSRSPFDFETTPLASILVQTSDKGRLALTQALTLPIQDANDAPTGLSLKGGPVPENRDAGLVAGMLVLEDFDAPQSPVINLDAGKHHTMATAIDLGTLPLGRYEIRHVPGEFKVWSKWDAQNSSSEGWTPEFSMSFDGQNHSFHQVGIYDKDPVAAHSLAEPFRFDIIDGPKSLKLFVDDLNAYDNRGGLSLQLVPFPTFELVAGQGDTDNALFSIMGGKVVTAETFNFEQKPEYSIRVKGTDPGGLSFEAPLTIQISDQPDTPSAINLSNYEIPENDKAAHVTVGTLSAADEDERDTHKFELVPHFLDRETDNALFQIKPSRAGATLSTLQPMAFDFETKSEYLLFLKATDKDGKFHAREIVLNVKNIIEAPTGIEISNSVIPENQPEGTEIGVLTAIDPDTPVQSGTTNDPNNDGATPSPQPATTADTHTFKLVKGEGDIDNANFRLDSTTGSLTTAQTFDFEADGPQFIRVQATDSAGQSIEQAFTLTIANGNDAPTALSISPAELSSEEGQPKGTVIGTLTVDDIDTRDFEFGEAFTFALTAGSGDTHNANFQIEGNQVQIKTPLVNKDTPLANFLITATDKAGATISQAFTLTVTDKNDAPTAISLDNNQVQENLPFGTAIGNFTVTDPDSEDTHIFSLVPGSGDSGNSSFFIQNGNQLVTNALLDFEAQSSHSIRVEAKDQAGATIASQFTISITDEVDETTRFQLNVTSVPNNAGLTSGAGLYADGETATLSATPGTGYSFAGWPGDLPGGTDPGETQMDILMDSDKNLTAYFARKFHSVTVSAYPDRHGYAKGGGSVVSGTKITLMAEELDGIDNVPFSHWRIDGVDQTDSTDTSLTLTVEADMMVEAVFDIGLPDNFVHIPAGSYTRAYKTPFEHVTSVSGFYTTTHEISKGEWYRVYNWAIKNGYGFDYHPTNVNGRNRSHIDRSYHDDFPITGVTWIDMVKWCNARSEMEGWTPAYYTDGNHGTPIRFGNIISQEDSPTPDQVQWRTRGFRLPTETEWERAARGGKEYLDYPNGNTIDATTAFFGNSNRAKIRDIDFTTQSSRLPNGFGLYDMAGNSQEACWDWYSKKWFLDPGAQVLDNTGPTRAETGLLRNYRMARGGSGNSDARRTMVHSRILQRTWHMYSISLRPVFPAPSTPDVTITLASAQAHLGNVTGAGVYETGTPAALTATALPGSAFKEWQDADGNSLGTSKTLQTTADSDKTIYAVFEDTSGNLPLYTIRAVSSPAGSGTVTGTGAYLVGSSVQLTATPSQGLDFAGWSGDTFDTSPTTQVTITNNMVITGAFGDTSIDTDRDGLSDLYEGTIDSNPFDSDSDSDGLRDGDEVGTYQSDPTNPDTDGDGHDDRSESLYGTSLTDGDDFPFLPNLSLIRHLPFRRNATDFSGNRGKGTFHDTENVFDRWESPQNAFGFNGTSSYVEDKTYKGVAGASARAISGWIRTGSGISGWIRTGSGNSGPLVSYGSGSGVFTVAVGSGGVLELTAGSATLTGSTALTDGLWHQFLVSVPDGATAADITLYINGQPEAATSSGDTSSALASTVKDLLSIGRDSEGNLFTGDIDEVRVWERWLHASEATQLFDSEKYVEPDSLRPEVTASPVGVTVGNGDTAAFTVKAKAKPAPTYTWEKFENRKWVSIKGASGDTLTLTDVQAEDALNYRVVVSNSLGSATSRAARLTVLLKPAITQAPQDTALLVGKGGNLYAHVSGSQRITYEWFKDGTSLGNSPSYFWAIPREATQATHGGTYSFKATNSVGEVTSDDFTLSIIEAVTLTAAPETSGILKGAAGNLSVTATGGGTLSYQWYKYDTRSKKYGMIAGETEATLDVAAMSIREIGKYQVSVSNGASTVLSKAVELSMYTAPTFKTQPRAANINEGTLLSFTTLALGDPAPTYQWQKFNAGADQWEDIPKQIKTTYSLGRANRAHSGKYRAIATNPGGSATSNEVDVVVYYAPQLTTDLAHTTANEGTDVTFTVAAEALDKRGTGVTYKWFFGRTELRKDGNGITGTGTGTLTLTSIDKADRGAYYCLLSNSVGTTRSYSAKLTVIEKPYTTRPLKDFTLAEGKRLTLVASILGTKPMTYQWSKDGQPIDGATLTKLSFTSLKTSDAGTYSFEATNPAGSFTTSMILTVTGSQASPDHIIAGADTLTPQADPDGDGLANLLEHALGSDPANPGSTYVPQVDIVEDGSGESFLSFHFTQNQSATDVTTLVEQSFDLKTWEPIDPNEASISTLDRGGLTETTVYLPTSSGTRFLRIRVVR